MVGTTEAPMEHSWQRLLSMTGGKRFLVTEIHIPEEGISIEGSFELPPLARIPIEDQIFIAMFIRTSGSIKQMESIFGISYPTVKSRLNRIAKLLEIGDIEIRTPSRMDDLLTRLEEGAISVADALKEIE
ncbi:MAG: DUF2089 domain-containing protein [Spirochaetales bacterium]|nr:DUF2089 domain-containing protein [Spirochaetales bacterium]